MHLHWHRRDLRLADNLALAAGDDPVLPVFVFDPEVLSFGAPPRVAFMLTALDALRERYRERGSDLLVARGDPCDVLPALAADYGADRVTWNRDYSGLASERDRAVRAALADSGVEPLARHDAVLHEPGSITTNAGDHYSVFSYFWKKWRDREKADPVAAPDDLVAADRIRNGRALPTLADLGFDRPEADLPEAGPGPARERLDAFCAGPIYEYADGRDDLAADATSRLSVDLKFGTVGVRAVYAATAAAARDAADEQARESVESFQRQLAWREFYAHVLDARPDVVTSNYREMEIDWRDDPAELQAWKDGETGYPVVDAGMRQLRAEGWMHNRARMIVASFLTKDLLIDWREGYDWFRRKLVDHDPGNDAGGWQWAASTGMDAQPYFRIFNPTSQGERHDPDAEYVRRYVPELRGVPAEKIHGWHELDDDERERLAPDYPAPIVDHAERREQALATFEAARED